MKIRLEHVQYMPKVLEVGTMYVSMEFGTAAHLCACGCGEKIRTPIGPAEWRVEETSTGPTLLPSVGNWQQSCQSHYIIWRGEIQWEGQWTEKQIAVGRIREQMRLSAYCNAQNKKQVLPNTGFNKWINRLFGRK